MSKHILIVEDDRDILTTIAELLEMEGYQTTIAGNGKEALEYLQNPANSLPDLIILDYMMPIMNGTEFRTEQLKDERIARVPVLLMTADAHPQVRSRETDVQAFIRKPIDIDDFLQKLRHFHVGQG